MIVLWLLFCLLLILFTLGMIFSSMLLHRNPLNPALADSPENYGLGFEEVEFPASDGVILRGFWVPFPGSDKVILQLHGYGGSCDPDIQHIPHLHDAGYNVLVFDFRAHGRSEGRVTTVGCLERRDVLGAVEFVKRKGMHRIGALGFSMGGITAVGAAAICRDIHAVVADGNPGRLQTAMQVRARELGVPILLAKPAACLALAFASLRVGTNLFVHNPINWVGNISPRPLLAIRGEKDQYQTPRDFKEFWAAAGEPKEAWLLPESGHVTAMFDQPEEYWSRVAAFFHRYL